MKMKRKIKVIGIISFLTILLFNMSISTANRQLDNLNIANLISTPSANAEDIDVDWSDHVCRCNNGICQDGNMISFRPQCANISPGHSTDENCRLASPSC